jgi:ubiquinone biosynthesis protein
VQRDASTTPRNFVERLIRLGPLYVKIGQILSTRPDVLPKQYVAALQRLQEQVPPIPFADVEAVVRDEFHGRGIEEVFGSFVQAPKASASVAQVHFATLTSGEEVAVKIQRLGVENRMRRDLSVLAALVVVLGFVAPRLTRAFNVRRGFAEFRRYTLQELDFEIEARTMAAFRHNFAGWHDVKIPEPFLKYISKRVLTMERVLIPTPPRRNSGSGISSSSPPVVIRRAVFGARLRSGRMAPPVCSRARNSRTCPGARAP